MKLFLDTAEQRAIERRYKTGLIDGVTTNPTLIAKLGYKNARDCVLNILRVCPDLESVSIEVHPSACDDVDAMVLEGGDYRAHKALTVKVPCTPAGLQACKILNARGQKTNVTLVFSVAQAILAAKAGATYVSPFVGRLDDQSVAGLEVVRSISELYRIHGVRTQVLAASIRSVQRAVRSWYNGAEICTMPPKVFEQMYDHILTDKGLEIFDKDWAAVKR